MTLDLDAARKVIANARDCQREIDIMAMASISMPLLEQLEVAVREIEALRAWSEAKHWQVVHSGTLEQVRRFRVPGGWLYQVEIDQRTEPLAHGVTGEHTFGWHAPVFVHEATRADVGGAP